MNQPAATTTPTTAARVAGVADAPDIIFVFRRYIWVIISGVVLGTIIAAIAYLYMRSTHPRYTASVTFQVLAPPALPGSSQQNPESLTNLDEINRFIRRQTYYIMSDEILDAALQQDAFQHDPNNGQATRWMIENADFPKKHLRKDLAASAVPTSDLFTINMTTSNNVESARLVNSVAKVYMESLRSDNRNNNHVAITELGDVIDKQKATVEQKQKDLTTFRQSHSISAITNQHTIETTLLGQMNSDLMKLQSEGKAAESQLNNIKGQVANGSLQLSAEEEEMVENDPQIRTLEATRLQLMQDQAVGSTQVAPMSSQLSAITTRIHAVEAQIQENRERLRKQAQLRMQENAQNYYGSIQAQTDFYKKSRDDQSRRVQDLDYFLVLYTQQVDDLKVQQDILDRLTQESTLKTLQLATDDMRVRKLGGDALPPDLSEISSPLWYYYLPGGFLAGLLISFGLAYVFELTNTRVRTPRDVTRTMQMPLLGFVPDEDDDTAITGELSTAIRTAPASMIAESFRQIRSRLIAEANGTPISTVLVASIAPGGGATTVACNLAIGMAVNEKRVLLIDANFYRPGLQSIFKDLPTTGLSNLVTNGSSLQEAVMAVPETPNLFVMSAGSKASQMNAEKLDSKSFLDLLETLKKAYDVIIFDGAPLSLVSDSITLGARVNGVIGVVRAGEVSQGTVTRVRDQLKHNRANFLGLVLNAARTHGAGYFKENYRSFYRYAGKRTPDVQVAGN